MKFLVHSSDCAYNTITKRWVCNLAQRFSNPTEFTLVAGSYRCSTADSYPIAVYLRSEALQKLCKTHHSIELAPHEIISDWDSQGCEQFRCVPVGVEISLPRALAPYGPKT